MKLSVIWFKSCTNTQPNHTGSAAAPCIQAGLLAQQRLYLRTKLGINKEMKAVNPHVKEEEQRNPT